MGALPRTRVTPVPRNTFHRERRNRTKRSVPVVIQGDVQQSMPMAVGAQDPTETSTEMSSHANTIVPVADRPDAPHNYAVSCEARWQRRSGHVRASLSDVSFFRNAGPGAN